MKVLKCISFSSCTTRKVNFVNLSIQHNVDVARSPEFHIRIYQTTPGDSNLNMEQACGTYVGLHICST